MYTQHPKQTIRHTELLSNTKAFKLPISSAISDILLQLFYPSHDVRQEKSLVNFIKQHREEVISLDWSSNGSYEQMQQSDATQIMLASTSMGNDLGVWRLCDLGYDTGQWRLDPWHYEVGVFPAVCKAFAWSPSRPGMLAVGGREGAHVIRLYDFKTSKSPVHTINCNSPITSLAWRKTKFIHISHTMMLKKGMQSNGVYGCMPSRDDMVEDLSMNFCEELVSTHGDPDCEVKLWQVNKHPNKSSNSTLKYWFTKVIEYVSHHAPVVSSVVSPCGKYLATLGLDESLRVWDLFERIEDDSGSGSKTNKKRVRRSTSRKKIERKDKKLMEASHVPVPRWFNGLHSAMDVKEEVCKIESWEQLISKQEKQIR